MKVPYILALEGHFPGSTSSHFLGFLCLPSFNFGMYFILFHKFLGCISFYFTNFWDVFHSISQIFGMYFILFLFVGCISFYFYFWDVFLSQQWSFFWFCVSLQGQRILCRWSMTSVVRTSQLDLHRRIQPRWLDACADPSRACGVSESCRGWWMVMVNPCESPLGGCPPLPQNMRTSLALLRYSFLSIRI